MPYLHLMPASSWTRREIEALRELRANINQLQEIYRARSAALAKRAVQAGDYDAAFEVFEIVQEDDEWFVKLRVRGPAGD
jgi:uncharacterized protein with von Willebrand factor type A (vWA) domain